MRDKKARREQRLFVCEGINLVKDIPETFSVKEVYIKESKVNTLSTIVEKIQAEIFVVKDELFDAVGDTLNPSGLIAVVKVPEVEKSVTGDVVLLLDGISDPGNLGTIIRSAAARGIKSVILANCAEAYSPKTVRAAMSGTFFTSIIECDTAVALELLEGYDIVALDMGGEDIYRYNRKGKIAITVGNEAHGVSPEVRRKAKQILAIPMRGKIESLNAAVSISIAMFLIR